MSDKVFTFWEGKMPDYIKLCMRTWKFPYTILDYTTINNYTDLVIDDHLKRFTLPQIADCIRVHVLRDSGGCWLDTDTVVFADTLPRCHILGNPENRTNTIGFLRSDNIYDMYVAWADYQDSIIKQDNPSHHWSIMGNAFTDPYLQNHLDIDIGDVSNMWAETYMVSSDISRYDKYQKFYFKDTYSVSDLRNTDMLMLHNSWTPDWYKKLSSNEVLSQNCTLSNILKEFSV